MPRPRPVRPGRSTIAAPQREDRSYRTPPLAGGGSSLARGSAWRHSTVDLPYLGGVLGPPLGLGPPVDLGQVLDQGVDPDQLVPVVEHRLDEGADRALPA